MGGLPKWRVDNLYTFIASIITMTMTIAGFYFAMVNRLNIIEQKQNYTNEQFAELNISLKERRALNNDTRERVITLESEVKELKSN